MTIKALHSLNLAKITKEPRPVSPKNDSSAPVKKTPQADSIEISKEIKDLQDSGDEIKVAKALLATLPTVRAHVVYEAIAKLKVGAYSSDNILSEAASKLLNK
jgi:hypothetical protein